MEQLVQELIRSYQENLDYLSASLGTRSDTSPYAGFIASRSTPWKEGIHMPRLSVELIPKPTWGVNVRTQHPELWRDIRKKVIGTRSRRCASCHNPPKRIFHVHEVFEYDEVAQVQKLVAFELLCEDCHAVKHAGRTITVYPDFGYVKVMHMLVEVNRWTYQQAREHLERAFAIWRARSSLLEWRVDLSYAFDFMNEQEVAHAPSGGTA